MLKQLLLDMAFRLGYEVRRNRGLFRDIPQLADAGPDDIIVDVGAHQGETLAELATLFSARRIYGFEPYPAFFAALEKRFAGDARIVLNRTALSDSVGEAQIYTSNLNLSMVSPMAGGTRDSITIQTDTLDAFAEAQGLRRIKLLKVDAEGHDLAVLRGAQRMLSEKRIDAIVVEVMFEPIFAGQPLCEDIVLHMRGLGYCLHDFRLLARHPSGKLRYGNAVFVVKN